MKSAVSQSQDIISHWRHFWKKSTLASLLTCEGWDNFIIKYPMVAVENDNQPIVVSESHELAACPCFFLPDMSTEAALRRWPLILVPGAGAK